MIGSTNRFAEYAQDRPVHMQEIVATVMHSLIDVGQLRLNTRFPREMSELIEKHKPISQLVS